jgi:uncharacterized membrane protein YfcA
MPSPKLILFLLLALLAILFISVWFADLSRRKLWQLPTAYLASVGFVTNFFDTLGIGSFATSTTLFRLRRSVDDELIPGTLNVGHALPTITQAFIYIAVIEVELPTLLLMIAASVAGAWLGAGIVTRLPRRRIQLGMAFGLVAAALLMLASWREFFPTGGEVLGLHEWKLAAGLCGSFVFGALMTIGIGAYAPTLVLVSLLGMTPTAAFPIMMGSCAFLMPVASLRFLRAGSYAPRAALSMALAGVPAVILAATLVTQLPLDAVRGLVVVVVLYTAGSLFRAGVSKASGAA